MSTTITLYIVVLIDPKGSFDMIKAYTHKDIAQRIVDSLNKDLEDTPWSPYYVVYSVGLADS